MLSATPPISASASDRLCPVPVELSRGRGLRGGLPRQPYVNDRPYAASSFLSVAIADLFRSAIGGRSRERPELAETAIPLEVRIAALPCRGGEPMLRRLSSRSATP
jgi:hypothetical protein